MAGQFFSGNILQVLPQNCIANLTPPTFAGISSVTPHASGSFKLAWLAATAVSNPVKYRLYIALGSVTAAELFVAGNLLGYAQAGYLAAYVFTLAPAQWPDLNSPVFLIKDQTYTLGIRAEDADGNVETNTVVIAATAIATGNLPDALQTAYENLEAAISVASSAFVLQNINVKVRQSNVKIKLEET